MYKTSMIQHRNLFVLLSSLDLMEPFHTYIVPEDGTYRTTIVDMKFMSGNSTFVRNMSHVRFCKKGDALPLDLNTTYIEKI